MDRNRILTPNMEYDEKEYDIEGVTPLKVFLGGTIDNGNSENWQSMLIDKVNKTDTVHPVVMYNPRRDNWPSENEKDEISKQIKWELYHLESSTLIIMNILGDSKSPISLLELGLFSKDKKLVVFCPEDYYRFDNVREVCERYGIPLYRSNDVGLIASKIEKVANFNKMYDYKYRDYYYDSI